MNTSDVSSVALAEEMTALGFAELSSADVAQLQNLILDYVSVTLCGSAQPWGRKLTQWASVQGAAGASHLIGSGGTAGAAAAALVNGTAAHGYELDDTHERSNSHPGAVVITAALSVAAEAGASGSAVLAAIAAGYETMTRIGMAANSVPTTARGFHATCLFGPFGAATAAAKLMGLDAEGLARAWGIALSMTGGSTQFAFEPAGTMVKRLHAGLPAHNGVVAAQLAATGLTAPMRALEGELGFFHLYAVDPDPSRLRKRAGEPLEIHNISLKPYSCCRKFHALIDALGQVTDGFTRPVEEIAAIEAHTPEGAIAKHQMRRPESVMAAQYSMPYIVGATMAYGPHRFDAYEASFHRDPRIMAVMDKVTAHRDLELETAAPGRMPCRVVVHFIDGSSREARVIEGRGSPEWPLDRAGILSKGRALAAMIDPSLDVDALAAAVDALPAAGGVEDLTRRLVIANYAAGEGSAIAAE